MKDGPQLGKCQLGRSQLGRFATLFRLTHLRKVVLTGALVRWLRCGAAVIGRMIGYALALVDTGFR